MNFNIEIKLTSDDVVAIIRMLADNGPTADLLRQIMTKFAGTGTAAPDASPWRGFGFSEAYGPPGAETPGAETPAAAPATAAATPPSRAPRDSRTAAATATAAVLTNKPLRQGDKTSAVRDFVQANPDGVTPKEILRHLRTTYAWARDATALANTVHTSLSNMVRRDVVVYVPATRTYKAVNATEASEASEASEATVASEPAPIVTAYVPAMPETVDTHTASNVTEPVADVPVPPVVMAVTSPTNPYNSENDIAEIRPDLAEVTKAMRRNQKLNPVADLL